MVSKTISLKMETYCRLVHVKGTDESFSDVIDRLLRTDEHPLYGLIGLLDDDEIEDLRARSREFRDSVDDRISAGSES